MRIPGRAIKNCASHKSQPLISCTYQKWQGGVHKNTRNARKEKLLAVCGKIAGRVRGFLIMFGSVPVELACERACQKESISIENCQRQKTINNILYFRNKKQREIVNEHMKLVSKSFAGRMKCARGLGGGGVENVQILPNGQFHRSWLGSDFKPCLHRHFVAHE